MSNIRYFNQADKEKPTGDYRENIRKHKLGHVYRIILALILVAGLAIAFFIYEKNRVYDTANIIQTVERTIVENSVVTDFNGNILTYSKDGANCIDAKGNLLWNRTFDMQDPMMAMCEGTVAFGDYGGSSIYVQKEDGDAYEVNTNMPIRKISISNKGIVAAVLEDSDITWVYLYDSNGTQIAYFKTTMEKSGYPVDVDVSPSNELAAVSYFYLDSGEMRSSVAFYNFGEVGQNEIDNYVSGYNYTDSLVPMVRFMNDETAFAVSDRRLAIYQGKHKPVSISDILLSEEIQSVYYNSNHIALVYRNSSGNTKYCAQLYGENGEPGYTKEFDFDYTGVALGTDSFVIYGGTTYNIICYDGTLRYEGSFQDAIRLVIPTIVKSQYVIVTAKGIYTVELK